MSERGNSAATYSILGPYEWLLEAVKGLKCSIATQSHVWFQLLHKLRKFNSENPLDKRFDVQQLKQVFFSLAIRVEKVFVSFVLMPLSD